MKQHKLILGKCDYEGTGNAVNEAEIEWSLVDGKFSASAGIWNRAHRDYVACGQMVDEVANLFPENEKAQRICAIWKKWHLNDLNPGSPLQENFVAKMRESGQRPDYDTVKAKLAEAGLDPDESFLYQGKPYVYGTAWLKRELPPEVIAEIESWSD